MLLERQDLRNLDVTTEGDDALRVGLVVETFVFNPEGEEGPCPAERP